MLICLGLPKKHIASRLGISYRTAEKHITNAKNKLGINSQYQLLDFVFSSQIVKKPNPDLLNTRLVISNEMKEK